MAPGSRFQVPKMHRSNAHPYQTLNGMAQQLSDATDLTIAPFTEDDANPGLLSLARKERDPRWRGPPAIQLNPVPPSPQRRIVEIAREADVVLLRVTIARMGQVVRELTVVGEQDETFAPAIETPNGV
jgi:hypothetical protein